VYWQKCLKSQKGTVDKDKQLVNIALD